MRSIDTEALDLVAPALGIAAPSQATEAVSFDDAVLQMAIDVLPLVRRARAPIQTTGGLFVIRSTHAHVGAGTLSTSIAPYGLSSVVMAQYPREPLDYDVWVLSAMGRSADGGSFTRGVVWLTGWPGFDINAGSGLTDGRLLYEVWNGMVQADNVAAGTLWYAIRTSQASFTHPGRVRLPRIADQDQVRIDSTADAAGTFLFDLVCGIFPIGAGVDGAL